MEFPKFEQIKNNSEDTLESLQKKRDELSKNASKLFDREKLLQYIDREARYKGYEDTLESDLKLTEDGRELLDNYNKYIEFKEQLFSLEDEIAKLERKKAA